MGWDEYTLFSTSSSTHIGPQPLLSRLPTYLITDCVQHRYIFLVPPLYLLLVLRRGRESPCARVREESVYVESRRAVVSWLVALTFLYTYGRLSLRISSFILLKRSITRRHLDKSTSGGKGGGNAGPYCLLQDTVYRIYTMSHSSPYRHRWQPAGREPRANARSHT